MQDLKKRESSFDVNLRALTQSIDKCELAIKRVGRKRGSKINFLIQYDYSWLMPLDDYTSFSLPNLKRFFLRHLSHTCSSLFAWDSSNAIADWVGLPKIPEIGGNRISILTSWCYFKPLQAKFVHFTANNSLVVTVKFKTKSSPSQLFTALASYCSWWDCLLNVPSMRWNSRVMCLSLHWWGVWGHILNHGWLSIQITW